MEEIKLDEININKNDKIDSFKKNIEFIKNILFIVSFIFILILFIIIIIVYYTLKDDILPYLQTLESNVNNIINNIENLPNTLKNGISSII